MQGFFDELMNDLSWLHSEGWKIETINHSQPGKISLGILLIPPERPKFEPLFSAMNDHPRAPEMSDEDRRYALKQAAASRLEDIRRRQEHHHYALQGVKPSKRTGRIRRNATGTTYSYRQNRYVHPCAKARRARPRSSRRPPQVVNAA